MHTSSTVAPLSFATFLLTAGLPAIADDKLKPGWSVQPSAIEYYSPNHDVRLMFDGYVQFDGFLPLKPDAAQEDSQFRRVRPTIRGEIGDHVSFKLMSNFSEGSHELQDAYLTYSFSDALAITGGKMKMPMGLEINQSSSDMRFIERSIVSTLLPSREYGVMADGETPDKHWEYELGIFTNVAEDEVTDDEEWHNKTVVARLMYSPFKKLQYGVAADYGLRDGSLDRPRLINPDTSAGGELLDYIANVQSEGYIWRITPQLHWYNGPFSLMTEYAFISQEIKNVAINVADRVDFYAGQVSVGYFLTGEEAGYGHPIPKRALNPASGQWGAWEVTGRLAYLDASDANDPRFVDTTASADHVITATAGLNWHLNAYVKMMFNYEYATFSENVPEEQAVFTRLQIEY